MTRETRATPRVVLRNPTRWIVTGSWTILGLVAVVSIATGTHSVARLILLVLAVCLLATLAVRASRSAVLVDDVGVTARADRFTRRLRWDEIDGFELRDRVALTGALSVTRTDGKRLRLMDRGYDGKNAYERGLADLRTELSARRPPR